jgi:hypothetical protein
LVQTETSLSKYKRRREEEEKRDKDEWIVTKLFYGCLWPALRASAVATDCVQAEQN